MARNEQDPAASTQQFRAFANRAESGGRRSNTALIASLATGVVVVLAVVAVLLIK